MTKPINYKIQPSYYQNNQIDLIEMWSQIFSHEEFYAIMKSHAMKYLVRFNNKNGAEDLNKADEYINRLKAYYEKWNSGDQFAEEP